MKKALIVMLLLLSATVLMLWQGNGKGLPTSERASVVVTTFVLYDLASTIAGDKVRVEMLMPLGTDVHSFEPTPRDMARLSLAKLFIYSGAGMEPWVKDSAFEATKLDISHFVTLHSLEEERHEAHEGPCTHYSGGGDPHYWLDPHNMIVAAKEVASALSVLDADNTAYYKERSENYVKRMEALDDAYKQRLQSCSKRMIVVNHNAFGYLAERYGFDVHAISALSPEAMPSAKTMAELSDLIVKEDVKVLFFESFVSDRLMKSLANETGASVDVLHPLANITADQAEQGSDYVTLMEVNLEKLAGAMECR